MGGRRRLPVPLLVTVFQLAAVTWLPAVHPLLHHTLPVAGSDTLAVGTDVSGDHEPGADAMCWACLTSAAAVASAEPRSEQALGEFREVQWHPTERATPRCTFVAANAVRAPPAH